MNPYTNVKAQDVQDAIPGYDVPGQPKGYPTNLHTPERKEEEQYFDQSRNYNPQPYGGVSSSTGQPIPGDGRMFDGRGEVNAWSKEDALRQAVYLLNTVAKQPAGIQAFRKESPLSKESRRDILAQAYNDPTGEGFRIISQAMLGPVLSIVRYEGWSRKIWRQRPLQPGEFFRIPRDVNAVAWIVQGDGAAYLSQVRGRYVVPGEFKVAGFVEVDIMDILQMNFDIFDRGQDLIRQDIERKEDQASIGLLTRVAQTVNPITAYAVLGVAALETVRFQVERWHLTVDKFLINRAELSDIVITMRAAVDPVTHRELLLAGYIGNALNCQIITSAGTGVQEVVPAGTFFAVTPGEYLGDMGERLSLYSEPFNQLHEGRMVKGMAYCEVIGIGSGNTRAAARSKQAHYPVMGSCKPSEFSGGPSGVTLSQSLTDKVRAGAETTAGRGDSVSERLASLFRDDDIVRASWQHGELSRNDLAPQQYSLRSNKTDGTEVVNFGGWGSGINSNPSFSYLKGGELKFQVENLI